jgi:phosphate transport system ATP-binding protein
MLPEPMTYPPEHGDSREPATAWREYRGGFLAQVAEGRIGAGDVRVVNVQPATVVLTDTSIMARVDSADWSWLLSDLDDVWHGGDEPWTILVVPGVADHGVSVPDNDAQDFRAALGRRLAASTQVHERNRLLLDHPPVPAPDPSWPTMVLKAPTPRRLSIPGAAITTPPVEADRDPVPLRQANPSRQPGALHPVEPSRARDDSAGLAQVTLRRERQCATLTEDRPVALAALHAASISAWFGDHQVLDQVSLEMAAGEVTALIGPSGCGKSTFLRILNRMHELIPSASLAGEVLLDGRDIYDPSRKVTDARREIGMVFQKPNPFPAMSIYDNVVASFKLTGHRAGTDEKDEVVEACLRKAGLWTEVKERLRQPGASLSGGQQQRLCIARALAIRPRVLLMDEPCSALDPTSTRRIEQTISELKSEVTIVIVTHNMQQAARVSDQCAFFLAEQGTPGAIVEHGPTDAMFGSPRDPRTSDYVNGRFG